MEAPAEIPRMYGSAMGFRTVACMAVPTTARPAPITAASSTRGKRMSQTI